MGILLPAVGGEVHRPGAQELLQPAGLLLQALAVHLGQGAYPGGAGALRPAVPEDLRRPSGGDRELLLPVERRAHLLAVRRAGLPGRVRLGVRGRRPEPQARLLRAAGGKPHAVWLRRREAPDGRPAEKNAQSGRAVIHRNFTK